MSGISLSAAGGVPGLAGPGDLADEGLAHVGADPAAADRLDDGPLGGQHQAHRGFPLLGRQELQGIARRRARA